jgi:hypothetical protein
VDLMTSPITLDPVPGMPSSWVMRGTERIGLFIPPQLPGDAWEYWGRDEWVCHRFDTEDQALTALGIIHRQHEELAA